MVAMDTKLGEFIAQSVNTNFYFTFLTPTPSKFHQL